MRKFLILLLTFIMLLCTVGLVACSSPESECKHKEEKTNTIIEATCTQTGLERTTCKDCGKILSEETISKLSHAESEWKTIVQASCTQSGVKQKTCVGCGILLESEEISKLSHDYNILKNNETKHWYECVCGKKDDEENHKGGTATCTELAICSVCNVEYGDYLSHKYDTLKHNETKHWHECSCGDKEGEENHKGGTATCTELAICSVCNIEYGDFAPTEGLCFELINNDTEYIVTDYIGFRTEVFIPNTYEGKPIKSIGEGAFRDCDSLEAIEIPNSVTSIGDRAFMNCDSLEAIEIPDSVTSIGERAFAGCSSLTSVIIPNSVTSIGDMAFYLCFSLTIYCEATEKPSGWATNWDYLNCPVVWDCNNNEVANDGNIYTIADGIRYALKDGEATVVRQLTNISSANMPSSVNYKGTTYSVTSIGDMAFDSCDSLTSVVIGNNVTSIGHYAFRGCSSLTSVVIPNSVTSIGSYAFEGCSLLTSAVIGNSVTSIGVSAFDGCSLLTSAVIGNSVTSIGVSAFDGCSSLTSIVIPNSVTSIGNYAFDGCSSLTSIKIPNSVTSIGYKAFRDCSSLTIYCEASEKPSGWNSDWNSSHPVVWDCNNNDIATDGNIYTIIDGIRYGLKDGEAMVARQPEYTIETVNIPSSVNYKGTTYSVTSIVEKAFYYCSSLTSIVIPDSVTSIGDSAFADCKSLTNVEIGNSVTSIGEKAFYYCSSLKRIVIGNSVTSIGNYAFRGCWSLTSVKIPNSVTSIGEDAFYDCFSLTIYCEASEKPSGWDYYWNYSDCPVVWGYDGNN